MTKIYIGDTGTVIVLDTGQSLAGAISVSIVALKPNGATTVTWAAAVVETTKISFTAPVGTFDQAGEWRLQALVVLPAGTWRGETARLTVHGPFN